MKTISVPPDYLSHHEMDVLSDIVSEYLEDQGIKVESFGWSIDVQYVEDKGKDYL
jgi:hypothetical protein